MNWAMRVALAGSAGLNLGGILARISSSVVAQVAQVTSLSVSMLGKGETKTDERPKLKLKEFASHFSFISPRA